MLSLLANPTLLHKTYTILMLEKSTALLSTPQPMFITLRFMPQSITQPQLHTMPQLSTNQLLIMPQPHMLPQLYTSQLLITLQPQLYTSQLHMLPQLYTSQLPTQLQHTTNQLLTMNQPMKDQLYTNMDTLSKTITLRLLSLPAKTVTEMPPLVATLLLFPMAAPNTLNTLLMLMVAMSLMFHTKE